MQLRLSILFVLLASALPSARAGDPAAALRPANPPQAAAPSKTAPEEQEDDAECPCLATDPVNLVLPPSATTPAKAKNSAAVSAGESRTSPPVVQRAKVLVLGDSLGLCGFGKSLDTRLRKTPEVSGVYSYMACGTIPGSWLKTGAMARAHTACGFWTIEGKSGEHAAEFQDTYGMQRGKHPDSHPVPKLDNLLAEHRPDILVVQCGTNLLSLFGDGKTLIPARHGAQLTAYLNPFMQFLADKAPTLKKVYWVSPPVSGRVSTEIQDFLLKHIELHSCDFLKVLDSRTLIKFPYRGMMPDKEHFIGRDMDLWAEGVHQMIQQDLSGGLLKAAPLSKDKLVRSQAKVVARKPDAPEERKSFVIRAKLVAKSEPLLPEKLLPYQESLVGYRYQVEEVLSGEYSESEIIVFHPAHIRLKPEPLSHYSIGKSFKFVLLDFDGSPWESIKRSEETGNVALRPFIRKEDEARFPSLSR